MFAPLTVSVAVSPTQMEGEFTVKLSELFTVTVAVAGVAVQLPAPPLIVYTCVEEGFA